MKYDIVVNNTEQKVDVTKGGSTITVERNGKTFTFQFHRTTSGIILESNGKVFHTNLQSKVSDKTTVNVIDHTLTFDWKDPYAIQTGANNGADSGEVKAVMPGRVVKVLVKKGQDVEQGQPLLVLEAMKMENEIKSPKSGKIADVHASEGASVESGALLISME